LQTLVLVIDGSVVGRGGVALMLHVVYTGRALPRAWRVRHGKKGHGPEDLPLALVEQGQELIPEGASVVLLGEGACDGVDLQHTLAEAGWSSGCRPGMPMTASWDGETFRLDTLGVWSKPGTRIACKEGRFPGEAYGPIMRICCWAKG